MKNRLVVTLTTVYGSRQYSLGQIARYLVLLVAASLILSFVLVNWLLVKTSDDLALLIEDHEQLEGQYEMMLGTQDLYKNEMDELSASLSQLSSERDQLQAENARMGNWLEKDTLRLGELNAALGVSLGELESLLELPPSQEQLTPERIDTLINMARQRLFMLNLIPNGVPIQAIRISDGFGMRMHPVSKKKRMHHGVDYKASIGTPVYATADGVVEYAGNRGDGYGKQIVLQHAFGFKTNYSHLNKIQIKSGDFVHKGQQIAESGNSGRSTGPHLHYEVRHLYTAIDPAPFVSWNITNFDTIFEKVKSVKWASLKNLYPLNQPAQL